MSDIEGAAVFGESGARLGRVERVLFHPSEPRAVAIMVKPTPALWVVARASTYIPFGEATLEDDGVRWSGKRLPSRKNTERALGLDMDATVIWHGMPAASTAGSLLGTLADARLTDEGTLESVSISTGGVGDIAYGRIEAPAGIVRGFDGRSVLVDAEPGELGGTGGIAKGAAAAAAAVKSRTDAVTGATGDAIVDASYVAGRALRSAATSAPARKARSSLKGIADAFREGYDTPREK